MLDVSDVLASYTCAGKTLEDVHLCCNESEPLRGTNPMSACTPGASLRS